MTDSSRIFHSVGSYNNYHLNCCFATGGDTFLQICLWEAGHAITSPGAGFYDWQLRSFDAGSEDRMGLVDYIMRAIEGTCHDRGFCNVGLLCNHQSRKQITDQIMLQLFVLDTAEAFVSPVLILAI